MVNAGLEQLDNGANAVDIKRGIDSAVEQIITQLRTIM
jgi:chaperonin GroEL (HSP60 family)